MGKLRILEEESKASRILEWAEILEALRGALARREEVALAVVHGGFVESRVFRDIGVAVFTAVGCPWRASMYTCSGCQRS